MSRFHAKSLISDPIGKTKSVMLTEDGLEKAEAMMQNCQHSALTKIEFGVRVADLSCLEPTR